MTSKAREFTFLVRMWQRDEAAAEAWRGSIHEVHSGERRFITDARDIGEFIAAYLQRERPIETQPHDGGESS